MYCVHCNLSDRHSCYFNRNIVQYPELQLWGSSDVSLCAAERVLVLAPLEQAAVLANATLQRKGKARSDSIADWLVAPAVEALLMQQHTAFAVAACTLLLRIRHELERARVRERGLIALQALYDFLKVQCILLLAFYSCISCDFVGKLVVFTRLSHFLSLHGGNSTRL